MREEGRRFGKGDTGKTAKLLIGGREKKESASGNKEKNRIGGEGERLRDRRTPLKWRRRGQKLPEFEEKEYTLSGEACSRLIAKKESSRGGLKSLPLRGGRAFEGRLKRCKGGEGRKNDVMRGLLGGKRERLTL